MADSERPAPGPVDLDRAIHEPSRLQIMAQLYAVEEADYLFLVRQTGLTWGNMSSHLTRLEAAGYVEVSKGYLGKRPHTTLRLTPAGRQALRDYRRRIQALLGEMEGAD